MEEIFLEWFDLYLHWRNTYSIEEKDIYNIDKKDNALGSTSSVKVITNAENKSIFCLATTNWEWVLIIQVIFEDRKEDLICIMFKELDIKPAWIKLIQNIKGEVNKWGGIEMTKKE